MIRLLYVSQLAEPAAREGLPDERVSIPAVFAAMGAEAVVIDATTESLSDPRPYAGVVVGGSVGCANDAEPWRRRLEGWLRAWRTVPLFGICGGHQLYARALGGRVEPMGRRQVGVFPLALPGVPLRTALQFHGDHVVEAPPGAEVWGRDAYGVQALRYPGERWTVQFHPELDVAGAHAIAATCAEAPEGWTAETVAAAVAEGKALLGAWLAEVRARAEG